MKSNLQEIQVDTHPEDPGSVKNKKDQKKSDSWNRTNFSTAASNLKIKTNSSSNFNSATNKEITDSSKPTSPKVTERDILNQIEEFRIKLNEELLTLLTEEKQKEDNREKALINCIDKNERTRLDKLFGIERAKAAEKINLFNE